MKFVFPSDLLAVAEQFRDSRPLFLLFPVKIFGRSRRLKVV